MLWSFAAIRYHPYIEVRMQIGEEGMTDVLIRPA